MKRWIGGVAVMLAATGCAGTTSGAASEIANAPDGCIAYGDAAAAWQDFTAGLRDKTITESDAESLLRKVGSKMDDSALIAKGSMQERAQSAATEAKQLRVALVEGDNSNVGSLARQLDGDMSAVDAACSAGK
jgi:hypothetical protein